MRNLFVTTIVVLMVLPISCRGQHRDNEIQHEKQEFSIGQDIPEKTLKLHDVLMDSFSKNWEVVEPAPDLYPDYFGGVFISNAGELVVMVLEDSEEVRADISKRIKSEDFVTEVCEYSYREMMEVMNRIDQFLSDKNVSGSHPVIMNFAGSIADILENRVVVHLLDVGPDVLAAFVRDVSDSDCIMFEVGGMFDN